MIHAREDYNNYEELNKRIPEDEPVFLLRGQDAIAWMVLEEYVRLRRRTYFKHFKPGDPLDEMSENLLAHADKMRVWPVHKMADLPVEKQKEEKKSVKKYDKKEKP